VKTQTVPKFLLHKSNRVWSHCGKGQTGLFQFGKSGTMKRLRMPELHRPV